MAACNALDVPGEGGAVEESTAALGGENLSGANLSGANLSGVNLSGVNLGGFNMGGNNLSGVNLSGANLSGTNLSGNNLAGVNLSGSNLSGVNLSGVNLSGVNLSGVNLSGSNLSGSNLAGVNLSGNNLSGTNLSGVNLSGVNSGSNIHAVPAVNGMLYSGEDVWSTAPARCVVAGIGSTAFAKLLGQQTANTKISVALGQLPWGFATASGGPVTLKAWEAIVWGNNTYCSFVMAADPSVNWLGVAGFIKAVFRWNAPPTQTMEISGIEAAVANDSTTQTTIYTYTGMMDAAAKFRAGTINETAYVGGLLAFASATTNNQSVLVDFSSWVRDTAGNSVVLGNVDAVNPPQYAEALYVALDMGNGNVKIILDDTASRTRKMPAGVRNGVWELDRAYKAAPSAKKPVPKRCGGALYLNKRYGVAMPPGKCDSGLEWAAGFCARGGAAWRTVTGAGAPVMNDYMQLTTASAPYLRTLDVDGNSCSTLMPVLSETYVHTYERPYDFPAGTCTAETDAAFCARFEVTCGTVSGDDNCGTARTNVSCGAACPTVTSTTYQGEGSNSVITGIAYGLVCSKFSASDPVYSAAGCTRGEIVRSLGTNSGGAAGSATITGISAPTTGTYYMRMWSAVGIYNSLPQTRKMHISVNGAAATTVSVTGTDWNTSLPSVTTVQLAAGTTNTIKFFNPGTDTSGPTTTWAPDLDRIEVATTPNTNPWGWLNQDVGSVAAAGSMTESSGTLTINGSGADIWGTADGFRFAYQTVTGDVTITARVASLTNTNSMAKAAVMMRDGLAAGARNVIALVTPASANGYRMQYRNAAGATSVSAFTGTGTAPAYVRVKRVGNTFTTFYSTNGTTFTQIGTAQTISMPSSILVGMAVTSHADGAIATGVFDNVVVDLATCTGETDASFCSRLAKNCGSVTGADNCGVSRTVTSCGTCTSPATCGGGGAANVCGGSTANLLANPTFASGTASWDYYGSSGASIAGATTAQNGDSKSLKYTIGTYSGTTWDNQQLFQIKTANGAPYTVKGYFVKAEGSTKTVTMYCSENGGAYTLYGTANCTNATTAYVSCQVTCTPPSGKSVKFGIGLGSSNVDTFVDQMSLTQ